MAPKRIPPKEDPPAPPTEEEEEEEEEEDDSTTESEDDEEGASPQEKPSAPPQSHAQLKKPAIQEQDDSGSDSESEEDDSDSDSDSPPPPKTVANVKPIASKPMEAAPSKSSTKTPVVSVAAASPSASKSKARKRETETEAKETKRRKEESASPALKSEDSSKKPLFQRIWGDEDEIALLNGLLEFSKRGADPFKQIGDLYNLVKKSLTIDISMSQLKEKAARLKKKFEKNAKGKDGEGKSFNKQHDQRCFDLSKKIWGSEASSRVIESRNAPKSTQKEKGNSSSNGNGMNGVANHEKEIKGNIKKQESSCKLVMLPGEEIEDIVMKKGLDMVEGSKREELEKRWKDVHVATLKLFVKQSKLMVDLANSMLAAMDED
ncbi:Probable transcription factor At4g00390 [Linum grandiflorum]